MSFEEGDLGDTRALRTAFGSYGTGVTVVSTTAPNGQPVGLTVNSFSSVSLDPPLVLWCLEKKSKALGIFESASHFAVNVLALDQVEVSNRFASSGDDKFAGIEFARGAGDVPLLPDTIAQFECETWANYDGGDHIILVGKIVAYRRRDAAGLLYAGGKYAKSADLD